MDHGFGPVRTAPDRGDRAPENVASRRVLEKLGFREEGLFRRYLDVDGAWRDHLLFALTVEEVPGGVVEGLLRAGRVERPRATRMPR